MWYRYGRIPCHVSKELIAAAFPIAADRAEPKAVTDIPPAASGDADGSESDQREEEVETEADTPVAFPCFRSMYSKV